MKRFLAFLLLLACLPGLGEAAPAKPKPALTKLYYSYEMGSALSLGMMGRARNNPRAPAILSVAEGDAKKLNVKLPPYPLLKDNQTQNTVEAMQFLLKGAAPVARALGGKNSLAFEIGIKQILMRALYTPGDDRGVVKVLASRCSKLGMPATTTKALSAAVAKKASAADVNALLDAFDKDMRAYTTTH